MVHKTRSLRQAFRKKTVVEAKCTLSRCTVNDHDLCFSQKVIYELPCSRCNKSYKGSTIRALLLRVKEHLTYEKLSVVKHHKVCRSPFSTSILRSAFSEADVRLKEALFIRKWIPQINNKFECDELKEFLFIS